MCRNAMNWEIPSSPDILRELLVRFASMDKSTTLESMILDLPDLMLSLRSLQPDKNIYNLLLYYDEVRLHISLNECFWLLERHYDTLPTRKAEVPESDYIACSSVPLSNSTQRKVIFKIHQLPWYNQQQRVPTTAWTPSVKWYTHHKLTTR